MPRYEIVNEPRVGMFKGADEKNNQLAEIQRRMRAASEYADQVILPYQHVAPKKSRPGQLVMADGVDWNPGSGAGLYRRNEANSAWVFVG